MKHLITGTGAGQWGTALAYACKQFGLRCTVFMVGISYRQKPQRPRIVELFGGEIHESPSRATKTGRDAMKRDPDRIGSLAVATGEAIEMAREMKDLARFAVGSGETCVLLHQTVIGNEAVGQMQALGDFPDYVIACMGAGSNFAGVGMPFLRAAKAMGRKDGTGRGRAGRLPETHPRRLPLRHQRFLRHDAGDPDVHAREPFLAPGIHAGGLRYTAPRRSSPRSMPQGIFGRAPRSPTHSGAGILFADCEGIIPAPELAYAVAAGHRDRARARPTPARTS